MVNIIKEANAYHLVEFEVLMVASMKMAVFWIVAACSLVDVY
jgi:hypothetical protein